MVCFYHIFYDSLWFRLFHSFIFPFSQRLIPPHTHFALSLFPPYTTFSGIYLCCCSAARCWIFIYMNMDFDMYTVCALCVVHGLSPRAWAPERHIPFSGNVSFYFFIVCVCSVVCCRCCFSKYSTMFAFLLLSCSYPIRGALVYLNSKNTHILFVYRARRWFICTLSVKTVLGKKCALTLAESYDYSLLNKYVLLLPFRRRRLWRFLLYIINDVWITKYISTKKVSYERAPACDKYSVLRAHTR